MSRHASGRRYQLKVLLSTDEKRVLFRLAKKQGLTVSDFVRTMVRKLGGIDNWIEREVDEDGRKKKAPRARRAARKSR